MDLRWMGKCIIKKKIIENGKSEIGIWNEKKIEKGGKYDLRKKTNIHP